VRADNLRDLHRNTQVGLLNAIAVRSLNSVIGPERWCRSASLTANVKNLCNTRMIRFLAEYVRKTHIEVMIDKVVEINVTIKVNTVGCSTIR
jgi:hypothetical protein